MSGLNTGWGLSAPEDAVVVWGSRAILKNGAVDVPYDRSGMKGDPGKLLPEWKNFLNKQAMKHIRKLVDKFSPSPSESKLYTESFQVKGGTITIAFDPKASYGYLYIGIWLVPDQQ